MSTTAPLRAPTPQRGARLGLKDRTRRSTPLGWTVGFPRWFSFGGPRALIWISLGLLLYALALVGLVGVSATGAPTHRVSPDACRCSVEVPWGMVNRPDLSPQAGLSYANPAAELYLVDLVESREGLWFDSPLHYARRVARGFEPGSAFVATRVDGFPAARRVVVQNRPDFEAVDVYRIERVIATPDHFHHVIAWTLTSLREENAPKLEAMIESFKLLEPST